MKDAVAFPADPPFPVSGRHAADPGSAVGGSVGPAVPVRGSADTPVGPEQPHALGRTRTSAAWVGIVGAALVLVLLLVFILQNLRSVRITYFTATGSMPLGAALLLAALGGVLPAGTVASLRILQLRRRMRRDGRPSN